MNTVGSYKGLDIDFRGNMSGTIAAILTVVQRDILLMFLTGTNFGFIPNKTPILL